jgi:hypothetical protein
MLDLVLTICLFAAPMECRKERMPWEGPMVSCAINGQFAASEWLNAHPKWRLARWRCRPAEIRA